MVKNNRKHRLGRGVHFHTSLLDGENLSMETGNHCRTCIVSLIAKLFFKKL